MTTARYNKYRGDKRFFCKNLCNDKRDGKLFIVGTDVDKIICSCFQYEKYSIVDRKDVNQSI